MKVQELRNLLGTSERAHLEKAFVECYKQLRKGQKEEIDPILTTILEGKEMNPKAKGSPVDFAQLEQQINEFIRNANALNYFIPNRTIPKSQRPKWRFLVKNYIKELAKILADSENHEKSVKLLSDLYGLICEACNVYIFSTEDPFRSIGWKQPDLYALLAAKAFANGYSRENISQMLLFATGSGLSRESLTIQQELILLGHLKTSDVKYIAIEEAKKLVDDRTSKLPSLDKYSSQRYALTETINELCSMIFLITVDLAEPEDGIKYFFKHVMERNNEIKLYCALDLIDWMDDNETWIKVYEYGISRKIKPRDSLVESYEERLKRTKK